jgi:hypothetical protein
MKICATELSRADLLVDYLCSRIDQYGAVGDPLRDRYVGFCAVAVAAHLETLVKEQVLDFCKRENRFLYAVFDAEFRRFNGRIGYEELSKLLARFDENAVQRLKELVTRASRYRARAAVPAPNIAEAYKSLLNIRHSFAHDINATFPQVSSSDLKVYVDAAKRVASAFVRCIPSTSK